MVTTDQCNTYTSAWEIDGGESVGEGMLAEAMQLHREGSTVRDIVAGNSS